MIILLVLLVLVAIALSPMSPVVGPGWRYGYYPTGGLGLVIVILLVLWLSGHLGTLGRGW